MSNTNIRLILLLGACVIAGIFIVQIYWVKQAFGLQDKQFDQSVRIRLSHISSTLNESSDSFDEVFKSIEHPSSNYYILRVNGKVDTSLLSNLMVKEFSNNQVKTSAEYAIYDSSTHEMLYGDFIAVNNDQRLNKHKLPALEKGEYYIGISFPDIIFRMSGEMYIWIFSTFLLLVFLGFFAYSLFIILKQKRLSELQRDFVDNMTHEFKTPLTTISLVSESLENHSELQSSQIASFVRIIKKEAFKLNEQVDKILLSSKSKSIKMSLKKENFNLHELIKETVSAVQPLVIGNQIILDLAAVNPLIVGDKVFVSHALQNLLENAIKYSREKPAIIISTESKFGKIFLSVEDNGIGINSKFKKKIFEPFFRVPTGNIHATRGFGIGLHYVKNIVRAHRWKILLVSEQDRGSKFTLEIPACA
jgi:two-component system phosphate regulon sensor histidine kinase PhoR